jgi:hypothetical protein
VNLKAMLVAVWLVVGPPCSGQVLSKVHDKERHHGLPGWGLGLGFKSTPHKISVVLKLQQQEGHGPKMGSIFIEEKEEDHV